MKTCTVCKQERGLGDYYKGQGACKLCHSERSVRWAREHKDLVRARRPKWEARKKEKRRANPEAAASFQKKEATRAAKYRERLRQRAASGDQRAHRILSKMLEKGRVQANRNHLLKKYGIDEAERDRILATQGGKCASCGGVSTGEKYRWCVDHDHDTNEIRGILCFGCNITLGRCGDNAEGVQRTLEQLLRYLSTVPERMAAAGLASLEPPKPRTFRPSPVVITEEPAELHAGLWC